METPGPPHDLDAIRSQLRDRGYLRGPLAPAAGWILGGRHAPSSFLRSNAVNSLKVAALGGPMMGLLAAILIALANRPHFSQTGRFTLLALFLSCWYAAALWLIGFVVDSLLGMLARRGLVLVGSLERLAARTGLVVGAGVTIYLALLLRQHRTGAGGGRAWLAWVCAVAIALLIGQAISRFVRIGALAALIGAGVDLREQLSQGRMPGGRGVRWVAAGLLALLIAALLVALAPWPPWLMPGGDAAARTPRAMPGRIVLIGVDGLDALWFRQATRAGLMPHLARLESEAARYDVASPGPRVPPVVWTTIATGRPPEEHGIWGFQSERLPGIAVQVQRTTRAPLGLSPSLLLPPLGARAAPISASLRRARAIWEILDEAGLSAVVVNWWATWPAASRHGVTISDRAFWRFHKGVPPSRDVAPPGLESALATQYASDCARLEQRRVAWMGPAVPEAEDPLRLDGWHAESVSELMRASRRRLTMLYLPGLDIVRGRAGPTAARGAEQVASQVDLLVHELLAMLDPADILMVLGEPGRTPGDAGFLLISGDRVVAGQRARTLTHLDFMPTLLALCGLPPARDLAGRPALEFLERGDEATLVADSIESYGFGEAAQLDPGEDLFDEEMLDRLRSLGYIR